MKGKYIINLLLDEKDFTSQAVCYLLYPCFRQVFVKMLKVFPTKDVANGLK